MVGGWDLTALVNAADARAGLAERHLWLVRLVEWLRHAGDRTELSNGTPLPVVRLRHFLQVLEQQPAVAERVHGMLQAFWRDIDSAALLADFGFGARASLRSELSSRVAQHVLPGTPDTADLASLFTLLFEPADAAWIAAIDHDTLVRTAALLSNGGDAGRGTVLHAITMLASAVRAAGFSPLLRQRMDTMLREEEPFHQLAGVTEALRQALLDGRQAEALAHANLLRAMLDRCLRAAATVTTHLEAYGVSVDIVYELDQLRWRVRRIEKLLALVLAPHPAGEARQVLLGLLKAMEERRGIRRLLARHYSLLARLVTERSAETGSHYITRDRSEYRDMLRRAFGGGLVIAGTTFIKFLVLAVGFSAFWSGFWAGANYALSFVLVMLLHWTVATKQPAMTAPAMAACLPSAGDDDSDAAIETFVDRVTQLIRSQAAGIFGNIAACGPLVILVQWLTGLLFGAPLVGEKQAEYVLHSLTLLGPTALFAAFTGVLLFASSLVAGWAENWFVYHRLDSAIAWNPRIVARLGSSRARRWATWLRANVSGLAANISLGMMLGLVPAILGFLGIPLDVRHVTLATGQLGAALGALGPALLTESAFWWCVAGIAVTGVLNLTVSFWLAFKVAVRSRGLALKQRDRVREAVWRRLRTAPLSFLWPPKSA
jgi:site-specific recombinase